MVLFITQLVTGTLFKETRRIYLNAFPKVCGTLCPNVWFFTETSKEAVQLFRKKQGPIKTKLHFHLQNEQAVSTFSTNKYADMGSQKEKENN